jgi:hypothetical protein
MVRRIAADKGAAAHKYFCILFPNPFQASGRCPTRAIALIFTYCAWRDAMDDHGQLEYATARGNDYVGHEQMYRTFVTLTKSAVAVIAVTVILMAIFLT